MSKRATSAALAAVALAGFIGCTEPAHLERTWNAMDSEVSAELYMATDSDAAEAMLEIEEAIARVAASMDFRIEGGELERLNRQAADDYYRVTDRDLYRVTLLALDYARVSEGAFDPTIGPLTRLYSRSGRLPTAGEIELTRSRVGWRNVVVSDAARALFFRGDRMELDLGGVAKGFSLDAASRAFARSGSIGGVLRVGGNLLAWGSPPDQDDWSVAIPDPRHAGRLLASVSTTNRGIAVSGHPATDSPRVLDPRTGRPAASELAAAVAFAHSAADADALATALFVSGPTSAGALLAKMKGVEAMLLVSGNGSPYLLASASLRGRLALSPDLAAEVEERVRYLLPPVERPPG